MVNGRTGRIGAMNLKKAFDKAKEKVKEVLDSLLPKPQPQLVPIPVRRPNYAPRPRNW
jgi:hypothetical protein